MIDFFTCLICYRTTAVIVINVLLFAQPIILLLWTDIILVIHVRYIESV